MTQIVQLQQIQERTKEAPWNDTTSSGSASFKAPGVFYLKALKSQLGTFRHQIPSEVQDNDTLIMHILNTELMIHEVALSKDAIPDLQGIHRLESLCACLSTSKAWFHLYLKIPACRYPTFSFQIYTQLGHFLVALYRLSVLEDPAWDVALVRESLDLSSVLDQIIKRFESAGEAAGLDQHYTEGNYNPMYSGIMVFTANGKRIRLIKNWWDAKIAAENAASNVAESNMEPVNVQETISSNTFGEELNQEPWPADDTWWQDMFGPWNMHTDVQGGMTWGA